MTDAVNRYLGFLAPATKATPRERVESAAELVSLGTAALERRDVVSAAQYCEDADRVLPRSGGVGRAAVERRIGELARRIVKAEVAAR